MLADGEARPRGDMEICLDSHAPHSIVPAALVRATLDAAKKAVRDYVSTGEKPPGVWEHTDFAEYDLHLTKNHVPGSVIVREGAHVRAPLAVPEGYDLAALGELAHRMPGEQFPAARPAGKPSGNPWTDAPAAGGGGSTEEPPF